MSYQEFLAYMAQYEEDAYQSIYTGAQIDEGVGKALDSKNVAALEYETVTGDDIRLKTKYWHTRGIYDSDLAKTQEEINAKQAKSYDAATVSGTIATFSADEARLPLKSVLVNIEPSQRGSGDPSTDNIRALSGWTGCNITQTGKNLGNFIDGKGINSSGSISNVSGRCATVDPIKIDPTKVYTVSHQSSSNKLFICAVWNGSTLVRRTANIESGAILDTSGGTHMYLCLYVGGGASVTVAADKPMVDFGTAPTAYAPYAGNKQEVSWQSAAGTVYAGTLDVLKGELRARPYYASYNGETLVGPWISDRNVYAAGTSPTSGAQVVDLGGAETVYQLQPLKILTLLGENNIWADCGTMTVIYGAYIAAVNEESDRSDRNILEAIAPVEASFIATRNYENGDYLFVGTLFFKVYVNIASGGTISPGSNVMRTTISAELKDIYTYIFDYILPI